MHSHSQGLGGHWQRVAFCVLVDVALVWLSFGLGVWLRFGAVTWEKFAGYALGIAAASVVLPAILYVGGLYSRRGTSEFSKIGQLRWLLLGLIGAGLADLGMGSIDFSARIGRGVFGIAMPLLAGLITVRHWLLIRWRSRRYGNALCLVAKPGDEIGVELLCELWGGDGRRLGVVTVPQFRPATQLPEVGSLADLPALAQAGELDLLLISDHQLTDDVCGPVLRQLRYEGIKIVTLAEACEHAYHAVPIPLVSENWVHGAATHFAVYYIRKMKRLFDVVTAASVLVVLSPLFGLGCLLVKLTSPGPLLYRQQRVGRMGKVITVTKLRTMRTDAELETGAQWSQSGDERIFPVGGWLRKFRIDEIPQLIHVLEGDMSFVGPRPERPEFVKMLTEQVPRYSERELIQPGLTGWAQVRYPYGASVADSVRKLEYDLYYLKHMSVLLDFFILVETVKVMITGGTRDTAPPAFFEFRELLAARDLGSQQDRAADSRSAQEAGSVEPFGRPGAESGDPAAAEPEVAKST